MSHVIKVVEYERFTGRSNSFVSALIESEQTNSYVKTLVGNIFLFNLEGVVPARVYVWM